MATITSQDLPQPFRSTPTGIVSTPRLVLEGPMGKHGKSWANLWGISRKSRKSQWLQPSPTRFQHPGPLKLQFLKETNDDYSIFREMWGSFPDFQRPGLALRWEGHPGAHRDPEAALSGQSGGFDENLMGFLDFEPDDSSGQSNQLTVDLLLLGWSWRLTMSRWDGGEQTTSLQVRMIAVALTCFAACQAALPCLFQQFPTKLHLHWITIHFFVFQTLAFWINDQFWMILRYSFSGTSHSKNPPVPAGVRWADFLESRHWSRSQAPQGAIGHWKSDPILIHLGFLDIHPIFTVYGPIRYGENERWVAVKFGVYLIFRQAAISKGWVLQSSSGIVFFFNPAI